MITNLPSGAPTGVVVSGPNNYSTQLTSSQTLQLVPGTYTVTANSVTAGSSNYYPAVASQTASVSISVPVSVSVDYSTVVPKTTKVLDSVGMDSLTISPDGSTITISTSSAVATSLAAGDILASAPTATAANGLLVKILTVSSGSQIVTASVQQAALADAIQDATLQFSVTLGPTNMVRNFPTRKKKILRSHRNLPGLQRKDSSSGGGGACAGATNTFQESIDVPLVDSGGTKLTITGEDDFCPSFSFSLQISGFHLVSMNATVTAGLHASIGLVDSATGDFDVTSYLTSNGWSSVPSPPLFEADPIIIFVGVGPASIPIVVQPTLTPFVEATGSASASASTGITTDSTLTVGISYANGAWAPVESIVSPTAVSSETSIDGQVSLKASMGLEAGALLYGIVSPNLNGDGYLQFSSTLTGSPCWTLDAGLEGDVGVKVIILDKTLVDYTSPSLNLFSETVKQATSTCFAPVLTSVVPNAAAVMSPPVTIALTGSNFAPDAIVNFNGEAVATTFLDPNDLTAVLSSSNLGIDGTFPLTVSNPDTPGAVSGPANFTISGVTEFVLPIDASLPWGTSQQFTAVVQGATSTAVTWSVNGVIGGDSALGTITQEGLYTTPSCSSDTTTVNVMASSNAYPGLSSSADATITTNPYSYIAIGYPDVGLVFVGSSINDSGQIIGYYDNYSVDDSDHGFLYSGAGEFSWINYPGALYTQSLGINNSGQIVGWYTPQADTLGGTHGFLYDGESFTPIDHPGDSSGGTQAFGMNNIGQIVGDYWDGIGGGGAFLHSGGEFSAISYPGAQSTEPYGINDLGQIVGDYSYLTDPPNVGHGFLYSGASFSSIDYPGATSTGAFGINDAGQIVGFYLDQLGEYHGFVYSGGNFSSIDYPDHSVLSLAFGINSSAQIVGYYAYQIGTLYAFVATPEPASPPPPPCPPPPSIARRAR